VVTTGCYGYEDDVPNIDKTKLDKKLERVKNSADLQDPQIASHISLIEDLVAHNWYDRSTLAHGAYLAKGYEKQITLRSWNTSVHFDNLQEHASKAEKAARTARELLQICGEKAEHLQG
jgi:hypothetical protein